MSDKPQPPAGERLAKVIARAGVCSRRDAESWITAGRISVNGSPVKTPAFNVIEGDTIAVDGKPIARRQPTQLWLYHKPAGLMVTEKDPEGRPTVFAEFDKLGLPRVLTVGRLDFNTEGLLLLTNDGGLKRTLELPATGWVRRYRVRAFGSVTQEQLDGLAKGITVEGVDYGPIEAVLDSSTGSNVWLTVSLREGKNREVRNVLGALGLEVNRLIRLSYGPFQLGDLPSGSVEKVKTRVLKDQLGKRLTESSGADFVSESDEDPTQPRRRSPQKPESRATERDRFGGLRKRPESRGKPMRETEARTVHFDDGRPSQIVQMPAERRGKGEDKPFDRRGRDGDKPRRFKDDKAFNDRPRKNFSKPVRDREEDGERPFNKGPRPDRGGETRPARGPRREGGDWGDRPKRKDTDRPLARRTAPGKSDKAFGDRPPRRDGDRPFSKGPRREGEEGRPSRGPRRDGDRPFSKGPRREGGDQARPARGPRRDDDRPFSKGPRREGGERKGSPRGGKPSGPRPDRPRRPRRSGDE
ncbi:pseudouridine synthase [Pelagibacterium sp. H642]|uniref:pseudouridine synthase n=1 Tax=Pelagibacterium sp. H642 TaxID=1881069 RepID=UPI002814DA9A|nr:pseudouridine synthase [Pelagibacterium sp. H642]WMT91417.1 pseudouridine synthase [Pelagibacterium sp. H642]